jgi:hypothetical protein
MRKRASAKLEAILLGRCARRFGNALDENLFFFIYALKACYLFNRYVIKTTLKKSLDMPNA